METVPRKMQSRASRHIFSASDDTTMTKNVRATHAPDDRHVEVRPLLNVVQDIFLRVASLIPDIVKVYMSISQIILILYVVKIFNFSECGWLF